MTPPSTTTTPANSPSTTTSGPAGADGAGNGHARRPSRLAAPVPLEPLRPGQMPFRTPEDAGHVPPRPVWMSRLEELDTPVEEIRLAPSDVDQDAEWCEVSVAGEGSRRVRFHDYDEVFSVPGLYEELFYRRLRCCSPYRVCSLLQEAVADQGGRMADLRVLDVGAGNGMVGDELHARGVRHIVGVDIIPEAREAALRDRPGVYADYRVADLTDLDAEEIEAFTEHRFNAMTTVAALGFGDIPAAAFLQALAFVRPGGWVAFNIKEDFLDPTDDSGFSRLIRDLAERGILRTEALRRYRHRLSTTGRPLFYVGMVARLLDNLPEDLEAAS